MKKHNNELIKKGFVFLTIGFFICIIFLTTIEGFNTFYPIEGINDTSKNNNISSKSCFEKIYNNKRIESKNMIKIQNNNYHDNSTYNEIERWALLIDINYYPGIITECANCLQHHGWKSDHIRTIYTSSYGEVEEGFKWLIESADENDIILLCSNNHGSYGYIVLEDDNLYYETIDKWLDQCKSANIIYTISACHSGSAIPILGEEGRVIMTSCGEDENGSTAAFLTFLYPESNMVKHPIFFRAPNPNGAFARSDLDYNKNGWISAEETFSYVKEWTETWHNNYLMPDNPIHPEMYDGLYEEFDVVQCNVTPSPVIPAISGYRIMNMSTPYSFYAVSRDIDNGNLWYQFDWGDSIISEWIGPYKSNRIKIFNHIWGNTESNYVKLRVKDDDNLITPWAIHEIEILKYGVDQYQIEGSGGLFSCSYYPWAQSFKPSEELLEKVEILCNRIGNVLDDLTVSIRKDLYGNDLTSISKSSSLIPKDKSEWVTFDFNDIIVSPGDTYYIVISTTEYSNNSNGFVWSSNKNSYSYPKGEVWIKWSYNDEWVIYEPPLDACFKTYYNTFLNPPAINGPLLIDVNNQYDYYFVSEDPEDLNVSYYIDWGDDIIQEWEGPFKSGEVITFSHIWEKKGLFSIRAKVKNSVGKESDWATIRIKVPTRKIVTNPIFHFFLQSYSIIPI